MNDAPRRWTYGVEPLPEVRELAPLLRRVTGLLQSLERSDPAVDRLTAELRDAERALAAVAPVDHTPRLAEDASSTQRVYVDHSRDIGAFNPCFPAYGIVVDGPRASGEVTFPLAFEGPPGLVHGGFLATFFDCVVQHHNCDVGEAGKTTSLEVAYRRPTPLEVPLTFAIERESDGRRIRSVARLARDGDLLCTATMAAVAGDLSALPSVPPRRPAP